MLLHLSSFAVYGKKLRTDLRLQIQTTLVVPTASLLNATNQTRWRYSPRHPIRKKYLLSLYIYISLSMARSASCQKQRSRERALVPHLGVVVRRRQQQHWRGRVWEWARG
jgi:hypothetical protein